MSHAKGPEQSLPCLGAAVLLDVMVGRCLYYGQSPGPRTPALSFP